MSGNPCSISVMPWVFRLAVTLGQLSSLKNPNSAIVRISVLWLNADNEGINCEN
jgi:hypothetical protein